MKNQLRAVFLSRELLWNATELAGKLVPPSTRSSTVISEDVRLAMKRIIACGLRPICIAHDLGANLDRYLLKEREAMHSVLKEELELDAVYYCPHSKEDHCPCMPPKIGLFSNAYSRGVFDFQKSYVVTYKCDEIDSARIVGAVSILVGNSTQALKAMAHSRPNIKVQNLAVAVDIIVRECGR